MRIEEAGLKTKMETTKEDDSYTAIFRKHEWSLLCIHFFTMPMSPMEQFLRFRLIFCHIYSLLIDMRTVLPYNIDGYLYGCIVIAVIAGQNLDFVL